MARLARVVVPGVAHHVTQRGNRRQQTFFDDGVVRVGPLLERVKDWREFLAQAMEADEVELMRSHERTGRPLGESRFLDRIEKTLGRIVRPAKPGRKPKRREK